MVVNSGILSKTYYMDFGVELLNGSAKVRKEMIMCSSTYKSILGVASCNTHEPTYGVAQRKVVALSGKYREDASLAEATVGTGDYQREDAHDGEHAHLGDEDAPQKRPDDVTEVQQHHVLEEQRRQCEHRHEVAQSFSLRAGDDVGSAGDVSAQDNPETLDESREELVDGHGGRVRGGVLLLLHVCKVKYRCSGRLFHGGDPPSGDKQRGSVCGRDYVMSVDTV